MPAAAEQLEETEPRPARNNYLMFIRAGRHAPEGDPVDTGRALVSECLGQIDEGTDNPSRFPPRLFLLLAAPAWLEGDRADRLHAGIIQALASSGHRDAAFIGSSVAGVIFDGKLHPEGVVLVCLASKFLEAKVASADNLSARDPKVAMEELAAELGILASKNDPNPDGNRSLLVFFPGPDPDGDRYFSVELHGCLLQASKHRIPIFGGGSSANATDAPPDWSRKTVQFDSRGLHRDSVLAVRIESDFPVAGSLARGLKPAPHLRATVDKLTQNRRAAELKTFSSLDPENRGLILLSTPGPLDGKVVAISTDGRNAMLLYPAHVGQEFSVLEAKGDEIIRNSENRLAIARQRHRVEKPIGCLTFCCAGLFRNRGKIGFELEDDLERLQKAAGADIVGCFLDGEAGVEESGLSDFTHWSTVRILLGDELRDRAITRRGNGALAKLVSELASTKALDDTVRMALRIIDEAGFEGAMISLIVPRFQKHPYVVAMPTDSVRFKKIVDETKRPLYGPDVLALVATSRESRFIADSLDPKANCHKESATKSGIISQYVLPLQDQNKVAFGVLQIDLGDLRSSIEPRKTVKDVLEAIASAIAASISRVTTLEEHRLIRALDEAFGGALHCESVREGMQKYIDAAVRAFGVDGGHLREWRQKERRLVLMAGAGPYYSAALKYGREAIDPLEPSSTADSFRDRKTIIENDAQANPHTTGLLQDADAPAELKGEIRKIGSYVNIYCRHGRQIGVFTLHSKTSWFFHSHRERCLSTLKDRAELLAGYLRANERNTESRTKLKILLRLQETLKQFDDSKTLDAGLRLLVEGLREAFGADVASVFLWEEGVEPRDGRERVGEYILHAQTGWSESGWEGAARYTEDIGWTGHMAGTSIPRVEPNVNQFSEGSRNPFGTYGKQIWGRAEPGFQVRGLSFPLHYQGAPLGVITLLIRHNEKMARRFMIESEDVLAEVTNDVSAHIGALVFKTKAQLSAKWRAARDTILGQFTEAFQQGQPEETLCRLIVEEFGAREALFYYGSEPREFPGCKGAWPLDLCREADEGVRNALNAPQATLVELVGDEAEIRAGRGENPEELAKRGVIRRAWFVNRRSGISVLAIAWPEGVRIQDSEVNDEAIQELNSLMRMVGPAYKRFLDDCNRRREAEAERRNAEALQAMSIVVVQCGHEFGTLLTDVAVIRSHLQEDKTALALQEIASVLHRGETLVARPIAVAEMVAKLKPKIMQIEKIIMRAIETSPRESRRGIIFNEQLVTNAFVEPGLTEIAFRNLISNALKAIEGRGVLNILTHLSADGRAAIVEFNDTGCGMSPERLAEIGEGFVKSESGSGVGFLLAKVAIKLQGGRITVASAPNQGTQVMVSLPAGPAVLQ